VFETQENNMKIVITSRHEFLSEGLKTHIEGKIRRVENISVKFRKPMSS